ncbi:hypothetical protein GOBAR_AA32795 [Gossypium barbadense]|uniref:Uncharacterized protein n=1 Tax=Gossypium barbadense TaxID=3634 RepID=A0A2P5W9X2_GOSBA|nr:hypothetical protein GOBAR_AA32795 [Gossypium barbadense]
MKQSPFKLEISSENLHEPCSGKNKGPIYEERRLQIEELDEWRTQKLKTPDKLKLSQDELNTSPNQLKVGDKVLLDAADPRITTSEPNEVIPLTVLNIFPYGTIEVIHPKFDTFKAYGRAVGCAYTTRGDMTVRYESVKTGKKISPTRDAISRHDRRIRPWAKLPKQHGRATSRALKPWANCQFSTSVSFTRGRHCQNEHESGPMYTGVGKVKEARHDRTTRPRAPTCPRNTGVGRMSEVPKFKNRETHGKKLEHDRVPQNLYKPLTIHHLPPQKSLTLAAATPHALPATLFNAGTMSSSCGKKAIVSTLKKKKRAASSSGPTVEIRHPFLQIHLANAVRAFLTTDPWGLFFKIVDPTYLEFTLELYSMFHLQTIMTNFNDPKMVQFCLGGLVHQLSVPEFGITLGLYTEEFMDDNELNTLHRHIHYSPSKC